MSRSRSSSHASAAATVRLLRDVRKGYGSSFLLAFGLLVTAAPTVLLFLALGFFLRRGYAVLDLFLLTAIPSVVGLVAAILIDRLLEVLEKNEEQHRRQRNEDEITRTLSRPAFLQRVAQEWDRSLRRQYPLSLLLVDADHFRRLNDAYGHELGDQVLRQLASLIRSCLRTHDQLGRYAGDQFAVLLTEAKAEDALRVAERIRSTIERSSWPPTTPPLHLTASIGTTSLGLENSTPQELFAQLEVALTAAKSAGRNRVVAASSLTPSEE